MPKQITIDQAYILGLLVGGGTVSLSTFRIVLPFEKWGATPERMREISRDILSEIRKKFERAYATTIDYDIGNKKWVINPLQLPKMEPIVADLKKLGLPTRGPLLKDSNLEGVSERLSGLTLECFLSGIFDARGSIAKSHRRFEDSAPVVSIEIPGSTRNFKFVSQLCRLLTEQGSVTDQILYNHPCQHSGFDPTYRGWKKGFKIRFLARSFLAKHSFAMKAKAIGVEILKQRQTRSQQSPCEKRNPHGNPVSIHNDIHSLELPKEVRSKIFFHYLHICAALGCPHAPKGKIKSLVSKAKEYTYTFPIIKKGSFNDLQRYFNDVIVTSFGSPEILKKNLTCSNILIAFPKSEYRGAEGALAFLFAEAINGRRHRGNQNKIISLHKDKVVQVFSFEDEYGSPILLRNSENERAAIISSASSERNKQRLNSVLDIRGININVTK